MDFWLVLYMQRYRIHQIAGIVGYIKAGKDSSSIELDCLRRSSMMKSILEYRYSPLDLVSSVSTPN